MGKSTELTIEMVEKISGVKLTYPNQKVSGDVDDEKYKELLSFGCSDIFDDECHWVHRDCWSSCKNCNFYPLVENFKKNNGIPLNVEPDFIKASFIVNYDAYIEELTKQLDDLKKSNIEAWNTYGSELCAEDMLNNERKLEEKINMLKKEKDDHEMDS